jgi:hypothetical protein
MVDPSYQIELCGPLEIREYFQCFRDCAGGLAGAVTSAEIDQPAS